MKITAVVIVTAVLLTSCGFHLRGTKKHEQNTPKHLKIVYLQSNSPYAPFEQSLRQNLRGYNINVINDPAPKTLILQIINYNLAQTAGSVSSNLQTRQYTLVFTVNFVLRAPSGAILLGPTSVASLTTFTADLSQMLMTTNNISQQYTTNLYNDAAFRLSNRLLANDTRSAITAYYAQPHHTSEQ
jgi:LPS-assembly lipoprotein